MSSKIQSIGIIDQRISGNSRYFLIWLGKTTVNHDNLSITFYRALSFALMYRNMTIDDMPFFRIQTKFTKHIIYHFFILPEAVISILLLFMCRRILYEISFKSTHLALAKQWWIRSCPDIPHNISALLLFFFSYRIECSAHIGFQYIVQFFSLVAFSINLYFPECSVFIQRNASMKQKISVIYCIKPAFVK